MIAISIVIAGFCVLWAGAMVSYSLDRIEQALNRGNNLIEVEINEIAER